LAASRARARDDDLSGQGRATTALYSRLVEQQKAGTFDAIKDLRREVIGPILAEYHGRILKPMGEGAIAEFGSVVDAVACAVPMQRSVAERQAEIPPERPIMFPDGRLGDVMIEGGICSVTASTSRRASSVACRPPQAPNHATFEKASEFFNSLLEQQSVQGCWITPTALNTTLRGSLKPYARALGITSSATEPSR
jgi:hypothetical protein